MYNHAPDNYVCPICALIYGFENEPAYSLQSDLVFHDGSVTAFLGTHQWAGNHGNVIIAPNEHFENIYDLPDHFGSAIHAVARKTALALKAIYTCDGISTRQHNEPAGNQDVWHYHLHVTPRYMNDGFYSKTLQRKLMSPAERAEHAQNIRKYIANHL